MKPTSSAYLTPAEVASLLGVSPITVRSWSAKGWLPSQVTPGGHRRFLREDVDRLQTRNKQPDAANAPTKVLLVDDDDQFRGYLREALHALDPALAVREAGDGFQAGLAMAEFRPALVLLDYSMPGMNGAEVCRMIKASPEYAEARVVAVTGLTDPIISQSIRDAGADDLMFKPVSLQRIREVLDDFERAPGKTEPAENIA